MKKTPFRFGLQLWALLIALVLWLQVHGDGVGTVTMEASVQIQGLGRDLVIVNDMPERVKVTMSGLRTRLSRLTTQDLQVLIDVAGVDKPAVIEYALNADHVSLPVGVQVEKIQPDRLQLQIDRIIRRAIPVEAHFTLSSDWDVTDVMVEPSVLQISGPEVWIETLKSIRSALVQPKLIPGPFAVVVDVESPVGKAIRLMDPQARVTVHGILHAHPAPGEGLPTEVLPLPGRGNGVEIQNPEEALRVNDGVNGESKVPQLEKNMKEDVMKEEVAQ
ncbi:MAG: hypothetical protein HQM07_07745 [Zetaproteobacteria bacterium]|nr:hypothetical protein [Zetaproteobacteria bacterium]